METLGAKKEGEKICLPPPPPGGGGLSGRPIRTAGFRNKLASLLKSQPWHHEYLMGVGGGGGGVLLMGVGGV